MADIKSIAEYTIMRLNQNGQSICPLKLQKVLYYMQAWHLVYFPNIGDLFNDIEPEAWVNGPVYRCIYNAYKKVGIYDNLSVQVLDINPNDFNQHNIQIVKEKRNSLKLEEKQNDFLEAILNRYGSMSHDRLVYLTHSERPWNVAREGLSPIEYSNNKISLEVMKFYYKSLSENK
ncbi:MAG: type II toxin-antitoxin system antitoxin SocA domain-containing protein [Rikenellaceae bacterium]